MIKKIQQLLGNNKPPLKMMLISNKYKKQNPLKYLPKVLKMWFKNQLQNPAMLKM